MSKKTLAQQANHRKPEKDLSEKIDPGASYAKGAQSKKADFERNRSGAYGGKPEAREGKSARDLRNL